MVPPGEKSGLPPEATLSQWHHIASFDSAAQCENILVNFQKQFSAETKTALKAFHINNDSPHAKKVLNAMGAEKSIKAGQCIASDDPRLKRD